MGDTWRGDEDRRTPESCNEDAAKFKASGKARSQLHKFFNQEDETVELPASVMKKEILELSPPDMLHVGKLGPPNDIMDHMFDVDRLFMESFYRDCGINEKQSMYGGHLLGPDVDKVWAEENVVRLLPFPNGDIIVAFLRALRELYSVAVRKILPPPEVRQQVVYSFRAALRAVVVARIITETPKCRVLAMEVPRYWEITGRSLYFALTEQHESTHAQLKLNEIAHGTRIKINRGTPKHLETLTRSVVNYSSKSYNLLKKIDEEENEAEAQLTIESVPEQEATSPEERQPSEPVPLAVYTEEVVADLQRQLTQAREELTDQQQEVNVIANNTEEEVVREITAEELDHAEENVTRGDISVEEQEPSDHAPLSVSAEEVAELQRQLEEAREEISAKDKELAAKDKIIKVLRCNVFKQLKLLYFF